MLVAQFGTRIPRVVGISAWRSLRQAHRPRAARVPGVESLEARALLTTMSMTGATLNGTVGSTSMTATTPAVLQSIDVTPKDPSIPIGELQPFTAIGTYSDNSAKDLTGQVTWASSDTSIAAISNGSVVPGVAAGKTTGRVTISATDGGVMGSTTLSVTPVSLEMIMVTPAATSVALGGTVQFMAMGMYSDNSMTDFTNQVTWSSTVPGVATISDDPAAKGFSVGVSAGSTLVTASLDGMSGGTLLRVMAPPPPPLVSVTGVGIVRNRKHLVNKINVDFSGAVNAAEASDVRTYRIETAAKKGWFGAENAGIIKLRSAVYAAALDEVTLTPKKPFSLAKEVQLRVNALAPTGLRDTVGRLIDGDQDGQAGGNAVALIRSHAVALDVWIVRKSGGDTSHQMNAAMASNFDGAMGSAQAGGSMVAMGMSQMP
jgi:hypothetical protein